jgi:hypothetical protein
MIYRQGDVLLERVETADLGEEVGREGGRVVLAHGEVSGHSHAIAAPDAALFRGRELPQLRFLRLPSPARLVHEEHSPIPLPAGLYRLRRQHEWTDDDEPIVTED